MSQGTQCASVWQTAAAEGPGVPAARAATLENVPPALPRRIPSLDGLRALAVLLVLIGHASYTRYAPALPGFFHRVGNIGVRFFFVISGLLITTLLLKERALSGEIHLGQFYKRRALRLFPASFAYMGVIGVLAAASMIRVMPHDFLSAITYTMNYQAVRSWWMDHLWSLSVEEQFYLLWPGLLVFLGLRRAFRAALVAVIAAPFVRAGMWWGLHAGVDPMTKHFEAVCDALAIGCLLSARYNWLSAQTWYRNFQRSIWFWPAALGLTAGGNALFVVSPGLFYVAGQTIANLGTVLCLDGCVRQSNSWFGRILNSAPLVYIGTISYSLYLWQNAFLNREVANRWTSFPQNLLFAFAAAMASYYIIEKPFLRLKESRINWRLPEWLRHLAMYGGGALLMNILSPLMLPIWTHGVSPREFGVLELLNRNNDLLQLLLACGMGMAILAFYQTKSMESKNPGRVFSTALRGVFLISAGFAGGAELFAVPLSHVLFGTTTYAWAVRVSLLTLVCELVLQLGLMSIQATVHSTKYVALSIGRLLFALAVNVALVAWLRLGLAGVLAANLLHTMAFAVLVTGLLIRENGFEFDGHLWREMVRFGFPFVPGALFMFILNNGDRYFLQAYRGAEEVGVYALAYRVASIGTLLLLTPFLKLWGGIMIRVATGENGRELVGRIASYYTAAYLMFALCVSIFAPEALRIVAPRAYSPAYGIVPLVALAYLFWSLSAIFDTSFYVTKKTAVKPLLMGAAGLVALVLYYVLIPRYGATGAAVATAGGFGALALLTWLVARRHFDAAYDFPLLIKQVAAAAALYGAAHAARVQQWHPRMVGTLLILAFPVTLHASRCFREEEEKVALWLRDRLRWREATPVALANVMTTKGPAVERMGELP